jgi:hypothetical protein
MAEGIKTYSSVAEAAGSAARKRISPDGRVPDPGYGGRARALSPSAVL